MKTTTEKIIYLEKLLKKSGCPISHITSYAIQILNDCKKQNKCVSEVELIKKNNN
tara:strand:+ start:209 stop:373 length:165 start_codon:yes stop_codon:yes gene_type:complete